MFKSLPSLVLAFGLVLGCTSGSARAAEPRNLSLQKEEIAAYLSSGSYAREVAAVALAANKYLVKRIQQGVKPGKDKEPRKMAVIFDVDETLLTNLSHMQANDFGYSPKVWDNWVKGSQCPSIPPVQTVYDTAIRGKIDIFFVTARTERDRASTERNLRDVGYETWTKIYFREDKDEALPTKGYKIDIRRKLTIDGYVIIANIGDQRSDLDGGYAEKTFKLPNPFYLTR